ncbi:MAG: SDR family NAD(P)-dependent oxidoreductase, partial [Pseudolabrys sp.]
MAKGLAAAGASIVIAGRDKMKAQSALSELRSLGAQAEFADLDVLKETSCHQAVQYAVERFGRLDILVNNAGTTVRKQPEDLTAQDWHLVMDTNLTSAFLCS